MYHSKFYRLRSLRALKKIGLFHVHVADLGGHCLICGHLSRPEYQILLEAYEILYDDPDCQEEYETALLRTWGYDGYTIKQLLGIIN